MSTRQPKIRVLLSLLIVPILAFGEVDWCTSRTNAVQKALNSGKLILLIIGSPGCQSCMQVKEEHCEVSNIRIVIEKNYVPWFCNVYQADLSEYSPYMDGNGPYDIFMPRVCVIDPCNPDTYVKYTDGYQMENDFRRWIKATRPQRQPAIDQIAISNATVNIQFFAAAECSYTILYTDDLSGDWQATEGSAYGRGLGGEVTCSVPFVDTNGFFKVMGFKKN